VAGHQATGRRLKRLAPAVWDWRPPMVREPFGAHPPAAPSPSGRGGAGAGPRLCLLTVPRRRRSGPCHATRRPGHRPGAAPTPRGSCGRGRGPEAKGAKSESKLAAVCTPSRCTTAAATPKVLAPVSTNPVMDGCVAGDYPTGRRGSIVARDGRRRRRQQCWRVMWSLVGDCSTFRDHEPSAEDFQFHRQGSTYLNTPEQWVSPHVVSGRRGTDIAVLVGATSGPLSRPS